MISYLFALFLLAVSTISCAQPKTGYEISVKVDGMKDSTLFLAHHFGTRQFIVDTLKLDNDAKGIFQGNKPLAQGIYMIVCPGMTYFEILVSEDQQFEVYTRYPDYVSSLKISGSSENKAFLEYQKKWAELQREAGAITKRLQSNKQNSDSLKILSEKQKEMESIMVKYLKSVVSENKGNLLATLVKSIIPVEMPEFNIPAGPKRDSLLWVKQYNYNKDHFFDNFDLTDERLLRTPILEPRLKAFFTNVVIQAPDSINKEIDRILAKAGNNKKVYQFVSSFILNHFLESTIMGHDAVVVKMADDIFLTDKADWVTKDFKDKLRKQVTLMRPNLIGKKGHDLVMDSFRGVYVSLYDIEKEFTVLYFWEPDCGHCKVATPKLKAWYDKAKNDDIEVFAVCTTGEKEKWSKYIQENNITWINGWDPQGRTQFDFYYNVQSTPTVYILDRDKKIIAKKLDVEDIGPFIENYRKYKIN
jgi:thiol-disulfide isomerase/thioredoxin